MCTKFCWSLGALVSLWQILDPSNWCGAPLTIMYEGRGDLFPWWRSSLVEATSRWGIDEYLSSEPLRQVKLRLRRDLVTKKHILVWGLQQHRVVVSYYLPISRDKSCVKSLFPPHPLFTFSHFTLATWLHILSYRSILLELTKCCEILF
jgi:hypothetical protein